MYPPKTRLQRWGRLGQRTVRMRPVAGVVSGTIYGNDEISCGGVASSLWHVTAYSDSNTPIRVQKWGIVISSLHGEDSYHGIRRDYDSAQILPNPSSEHRKTATTATCLRWPRGMAALTNAKLSTTATASKPGLQENTSGG